MEKREPFFWLTVSSSVVILAFIVLSLFYMVTAPSVSVLMETLKYVLISKKAKSADGSIPLKGEIRRVVDHGFYFSIAINTAGVTFQSVMPKSMLGDIDPRDWQEVYVHLRPSNIQAF